MQLFFKMRGFCLLLLISSVTSQKFKLGLLAQTHLGKDPTGGNSISESSKARPQEQRLCCCSLSPTCPNVYNGADQFYDYEDEISSGIISPRFRESSIGLRIANNPPPSELYKASSAISCPSGRLKCCYEDVYTLEHLGNTCTTSLEKEVFQQSCPQNVPSSGRAKTCGSRGFSHVPGREQGQSSPEEFPWNCLILTHQDEFVGACVIIPEGFDNQVHINTRKVLTAAHKIIKYKADELKIRVLDYDAEGFNYPERQYHEEYGLASISIHPLFDKVRVSNDMAVLRVDRPIDLQRPGVNAACLPSCPDMFGYTFSNGTGARCWVAGWGKESLDGSYSLIQKKVDVPLVPQKECEYMIKLALRGRSRRMADRFRLHESEICAGGESGKDACEGDGGAPLVCQSTEGKWHVVGLVTWGIGCANKNVPGIYARVSYFRGWIESMG